MLYGIRRLKLKLILLLFSCFSIVIHLNFDFVSSRFHRNIKKVIVDPERPTKKAKLVIQHIFFDEHPINNNNNKCYLARVISSAKNSAINEGPGKKINRKYTYIYIKLA